MKITYLFNSGFAVEFGQVLLVFDDYKDPAHAVARCLHARGQKSVFFFASHGHFDHFNGEELARFAPQVTRFFLSSDIKGSRGASLLPAERVTWLAPYEDWSDETIAVTSYSSTDLGTSFRVATQEGTVFHAGDFNWWDWLGDTHENRQLAANGFHKQLRRLEDMEADVAFFPVDGRLGASKAKGAKEFCAATQVRALVTMHNVGYPQFEVPEDFFAPGRAIPVWSPTLPGETRELVFLDKKGEFR